MGKRLLAIEKNCIMKKVSNFDVTLVAVMCELNLVKVQCVTVKLLTIMSNNSNVIEYKKHKNDPKAIIFKMSVVVNPEGEQ